MDEPRRYHHGSSGQFRIIASTDKVAVAAYQAKNEKLWGVQFHPEVYHTEDGTQILKNFVVDICGGKQDWSAASFIETTVAALKEQVGDDKVVLGLSGGVDSSVAAVLLNKAIGKKSDLYLRGSWHAPQKRVQERAARL